jgi:cell wall-associated NlpC family hydrolase
MTWEQVIRALVGTPYAWGARGPDSYDCWGLFLRARELAGLPSCGERTPSSLSESSGMMAAEAETPLWRSVVAPQGGDAILLRGRAKLHHIGVITPFGVLHTTRKYGGVVMSIASLRLSGYEVRGFYQWAG